MSVVRSRLQKEVLRLYRDFLRTVSTPRDDSSISKLPAISNLTASERLALRETIKSEFRREASLYKRTDILQIEAALRRGQRRLEDLQSGTVQRITRVAVPKS
ncbi:hypothetical protein FGIG_09606 [Fasciola gigantica]|uniref:Complex 1 LYR protein domain-containing protein n=2 Tax=Fasciola TaxID=6191 RepID=A0A4E0S0Y6_FASHE|nr:hypothetical protein D915_003180 [Fasciola hepatica]TPP66027.1 hypothetical protein FGIG_09606 [Fasciola gigantica]